MPSVVGGLPELLSTSSALEWLGCHRWTIRFSVFLVVFLVRAIAELIRLRCSIFSIESVALERPNKAYCFVFILLCQQGRVHHSIIGVFSLRPLLRNSLAVE